MTNTSNSTHRIYRQCTRLALVSVLVLHAVGVAFAQASAVAVPAAAGFDVSSLRPALANLQATVNNLTVSRWKIPNASRAVVEQDVASIQKDLNGTLPGLVTQAQAAGPGTLQPAFAVFRNLDALYDVLLRVTETASFGNATADATSLDQARIGLEDARARLGTWLLQSIGAQDAEVVRLRTPPPPPAAAPPPAKTVIDDGPTPPKPRKKKPVPAPAPQ